MAECKTLKEEHFGEIERIKKDNEVLLNECESEKQEVVMQLERAATNLQNSQKDNSKLKDDLVCELKQLRVFNTTLRNCEVCVK